MEEILNTYQNIPEVIKTNIISAILAESNNMGLTEAQLSKINYIVDTSLTQGAVNGYEALQAVITSKVTKSPRRKTK